MKEMNFKFKGALPSRGIDETSIPVRALTKNVLCDPLKDDEETAALIPDVGKFPGQDLVLLSWIVIP